MTCWHPKDRKVVENGPRLVYVARTEFGRAMPQLSMPAGAKEAKGSEGEGAFKLGELNYNARAQVSTSNEVIPPQTRDGAMASPSKAAHYTQQLHATLLRGAWHESNPGRAPNGSILSWSELLRKYRKHTSNDGAWRYFTGQSRMFKMRAHGGGA